MYRNVSVLSCPGVSFFHQLILSGILALSKQQAVAKTGTCNLRVCVNLRVKNSRIKTLLDSKIPNHNRRSHRTK